MKLRLVPAIGIILCSLAVGGCEQAGGPTIPPTKGGTDAIESPFGPATNVKPRKTATPTKTLSPDR